MRIPLLKYSMVFVLALPALAIDVVDGVLNITGSAKVRITFLGPQEEYKGSDFDKFMDKDGYLVLAAPSGGTDTVLRNPFQKIEHNANHRTEVVLQSGSKAMRAYMDGNGKFNQLVLISSPDGMKSAIFRVTLDKNKNLKVSPATGVLQAQKDSKGNPILLVKAF